MGISVENITKTFHHGRGGTNAILDLSLSVSDNEIVAIIGANGSGKTTLLNLIAGLDTPDSGVVKLDNAENSIGYVWQDYRASLLPWLTAYDNIAFPLKLKGLPEGEIRNTVDDLLKGFHIHFADKKVYQLSGGEQQLVCLLRSIAAKPDILLCDEPFSALDQPHSWTMAFYLEKFWMKRQFPMIFVSHDIDEGILLGSRIALMTLTGNIQEWLYNSLPRPRNIEMLNSSEYINHRKKVIQFLEEWGEISEE